MISESLQEHILYDKIYQYLWVQSDISNPPAILIPETIIIIRSLPVFWYYSGKETGELRKRKRDNITKQNIKNKWLKDINSTGVVGCLLHFIENLDLSGKNKNQKLTISSEIQTVYFNEQSFNEFLDNNEIQLPFGILQKFIDPQEDYNSQIQAIWSKSITLFTKRTSLKPLKNKKLNVYERCCTFEGPEYFSVATQVKDFQSQRISEQINKMINHLDAISFGKLNITQGTFYFKVDKNAKCWFLFCGNLKFEGEKTLSTMHLNKKMLYNSNQLQIPKNIDNIMSVYNTRPVKLDKDLQCLRCNQFEKPCNFKSVPYQYIIEECEMKGIVLNEKDWPRQLKDQAKEVKLSAKDASDDPKYLNTVTQIPITLELIHQKMSHHNYQEYKKDFEFCNKQLKVCTNCYMELAEIQQKGNIKKARDDLEYQVFMKDRKAKIKFFKPRVQCLNAKREQWNQNANLQDRKKFSSFTSKQNNSSTKQSNHKTASTGSEMTIQQYIEVKMKKNQSQQQLRKILKQSQSEKLSVENVKQQQVPSTADYNSKKNPSEVILFDYLQTMNQKPKNLSLQTSAKTPMSTQHIRQNSPYYLALKCFSRK